VTIGALQSRSAGGVSAARLGGARLVQGAVRYLDDETPPSCLHVAFVRSAHAHAVLAGVDTAEAERSPGVRAVLDGQAARSLIGDLMCLAHPIFTGLDGPIPLPTLAIGQVHFVGEPVALVVADTEQQARRAAAAVRVAYEPLAALIDLDAALAPAAATLYPQLASNVLMAGVVADGDAEAALADAELVLTGCVELGRASAVPLEPRGCVAVWDEADGRLLVRASVQQPHMLRADLARLLALPESDIRVVAPALGGAFGFKFIGSAEEPLTCLMARRLGRPVRWVETRAEALLTGAREYRASYRIGYDQTGRVAALSVDLDANVGALSATPGLLMPAVAAATFPGGYDVADFTVRWRAVVTNKGPWNGARGYGKEATAVVLETALDAVARELGADPVTVRRANLLRSAQLPHRTASMTIDSGDYHTALDTALSLAGYHEARARQRNQDPTSPTRLGIGVAFELTPEGMDFAGSVARGSETSTVRVDTSGHVTVLTGATSPGTGSDTAIAQLVAERIGVPVDWIRVVQGDTDRTPYGGGSFSSRAVLAGGTAAWMAADEIRQSFTRAATVLLGAAEAEIEVADGRYRVTGDPARAIPVPALATYVRQLGSALPGMDREQLEATSTYTPGNLQSIPDETGRLQQYPTYAYGVYIAEVDVDTDTGNVAAQRVTAVHDCGTRINPRMVDAQMHGAIAMGVGLALHEEETYTPEGQPESTDFKRYLLPRLADMPEIRLGSLESPSPFSLLGTKGAGESGVGGTAAAIAGAVRDAVADIDPAALRTPMTPARVLAALDHAAETAAGASRADSLP